MEVSYPKVVKVVCNCVYGNINKEMEEKREIGLHGLYYKLLE